MANEWMKTAVEMNPNIENVSCFILRILTFARSRLPSLVGVCRAERPLAGPGHEALGLVEGGVGVAHGAVVEEIEVVRVVRVHRVRPHHLLLVEVQRRHSSHGLRA